MQTIDTRMWLGVAAVLAAAWLGGCASMSESECRTVDWRTIGYEDGVAGFSGNHIAQHRKACAKYGVTPDLTAYQTGREQGLREYCKPANGFRIGARGQVYGGVCPADMEKDFAGAYDSGRYLFTLRSRASEAERDLHARRHELEECEQDMLHNSAIIIAKESTAEERAQALLDTKQLAERSGRLKNEIPALERRAAHAQRELDDYRASLTYAE